MTGRFDQQMFKRSPHWRPLRASDLAGHTAHGQMFLFSTACKDHFLGRLTRDTSSNSVTIYGQDKNIFLMTLHCEWKVPVDFVMTETRLRKVRVLAPSETKTTISAELGVQDGTRFRPPLCLVEPVPLRDYLHIWTAVNERIVFFSRNTPIERLKDILPLRP